MTGKWRMGLVISEWNVIGFSLCFFVFIFSIILLFFSSICEGVDTISGINNKAGEQWKGTNGNGNGNGNGKAMGVTRKTEKYYRRWTLMSDT